MAQSQDKAIVVVGGGISGLTTAVEAAEAGYNVTLVEKKPYLGGRVAQLNRYFPKLCPPYCGLEINFRRIKQNPRIKFHTLAEVESVTGAEGDFTVKIKLNSRYVNEKCTACNACAEACTSTRPNDFNFGLNNQKAAYIAHDLAYPARYVIDKGACAASCKKCVDACKYNAVELDMQPKTIEVKAGSVVYATGWNPYDAAKMDNLGFGSIKNVITNMMMERLASPNGPTAGKLLRPSDGKEAKTVAFVQCAGSRDENHLKHCSAVCCMASLKQATYVRERSPEDGKAFIYYIDLRTPGRYEDFLNLVNADANVSLVKGKVARIEEDPATKDPIVVVEDVVGGNKIRRQVDMVVLATGMEPSAKGSGIGMKLEENGFINAEGQEAGTYAAGVAKRPNDVSTSVQDATAMALKSIQSMVRR